MSGSRMKFVDRERHNKNQRLRWKMTKTSKFDAGSWYIWPCWLPLGGESALLSGSGGEKKNGTLHGIEWEFNRKTVKHLTPSFLRMDFSLALIDSPALMGSIWLLVLIVMSVKFKQGSSRTSLGLSLRHWWVSTELPKARWSLVKFPNPLYLTRWS